jgi:putative nucleotidyltransferase with HDIG domain
MKKNPDFLSTISGDYFPIPVKRLLADTVPAFDLFMDQHGKIVLYRKANLPFSSSALGKLSENNVSTLLIRKVDLKRYAEYRQRIKKENNKQKNIEGYKGIYSDPEQRKQYHQIMQNYRVVEKEAFLPEREPNFPLFYRYNSNKVNRIENSSPEQQAGGLVGSPLPEMMNELLIRTEDVDKYNSYIDDASTNCGESPPLEYQAILIREKTKLLTEQFLQNPKSSSKLQAVVEITGEFVDNVFSNQQAMKHLLNLKTYDFRTYQHSVNVALLAASIGFSCGMFRDDLCSLTLGGLLHDIGKTRIDVDLLNKPGFYSLDESNKVKQHVEYGLEILGAHKELSYEVRQMVAQHHERLSGRGYPNALTGKSISVEGRILAVAEVYDAMTSKRTYKRPEKPEVVLKYLSKSVNEFDCTIVARLKELI